MRGKLDDTAAAFHHGAHLCIMAADGHGRLQVTVRDSLHKKFIIQIQKFRKQFSNSQKTGKLFQDILKVLEKGRTLSSTLQTL